MEETEYGVLIQCLPKLTIRVVCMKHPKYRGIRKPKCKICMELYEARAQGKP